MKNFSLILALRSAAKAMSFGGRVLLAQRLLRRCFRHAHGMVLINDFDGDLTINLSLSEHMQRRIFWMNYYNQEVIALLDRIVQPGMVFIDVGANIGEITLAAAKRVGPNGRVISFEPIDSIAANLEENVARNRMTQVAVARVGVADSVGTAPIYASCGQGDDHDENRGLGSLYGATEQASPVQTIEITTLDRYLERHAITRLDIIKIDIEGAELPCLKGAEHTLRNYQPLLIIEVQEQSSIAAGYRQTDILNHLSLLGYTFQSIGRNGHLRPLNASSATEYQNVLCTATPDSRRRYEPTT